MSESVTIPTLTEKLKNTALLLTAGALAASGSILALVGLIGGFWLTCNLMISPAIAGVSYLFGIASHVGSIIGFTGLLGTATIAGIAATIPGALILSAGIEVQRRRLGRGLFATTESIVTNELAKNFEGWTFEFSQSRQNLAMRRSTYGFVASTYFRLNADLITGTVLGAEKGHKVSRYRRFPEDVVDECVPPSHLSKNDIEFAASVVSRANEMFWGLSVPSRPLGCSPKVSLHI